MNYRDLYKERKYKTKYLQLKNSLNQNNYLQQTQSGGAYEYIEHADKKVLVQSIADMYEKNVASDDLTSWYVVSIGKLPSKNFIAELSTVTGSAGATRTFKERVGSVDRGEKSYKFRPLIEVSDDMERRKIIIKTCLLTLMNFVDNTKYTAFVSGKFWMKNIKDCQCGKFFDFYGNYQNPDEFVLFKETLIKLCMELYKFGCQKEERCDILTPTNMINLPPDAYNKKYINPTDGTIFGVSYESNYMARKIDYTYLTYNGIHITYRNDNLDIVYSFSGGNPTAAEIRGVIERHPDIFTNKTIINSSIFEMYMFNEIIKEKAKIASDFIPELKVEHTLPLLFFDLTYSLCNICNSSCIKDNLCKQCNSWKCSCLKYNKEDKCPICSFWRCSICTNINSSMYNLCTACMTPVPA